MRLCEFPWGVSSDSCVLAFSPGFLWCGQTGLQWGWRKVLCEFFRGISTPISCLYSSLNLMKWQKSQWYNRFNYNDSLITKDLIGIFIFWHFIFTVWLKVGFRAQVCWTWRGVVEVLLFVQTLECPLTALGFCCQEWFCKWYNGVCACMCTWLCWD